MAVTDLVLLDIKEINDERHKCVTSHTNKTILACAKYLSDIGKQSGFVTFWSQVWQTGMMIWSNLENSGKTLKNVDGIWDPSLPYLWGDSNGVVGIPYKLGGCETTDKEQIPKTNAKDLMETESYQIYLKQVKG